MTGQKKKKGVNEQEWIDRLTKKEEKKKGYEDPNTTFKPQLSKKNRETIRKERVEECLRRTDSRL